MVVITDEPAAAPGLDPLADLERALCIVRSVVEQHEPDRVSGEQAAVLLERLVKLERAVAAGRLGYARRAADCMGWREEGHPSAAAWLAQKTKISMGEAIATLETASTLPTLPATMEALRLGELSVPQVREIAAAAKADPLVEGDLIEAAGYLSLKGLQNRARAMRAAATPEPERIKAIERGRFLRHWSDPDGAFHLHARLTPDAGAEILSAVKSRAMFVIDECTRGEPLTLPMEAYEADALVALVSGDYRQATFEGNIGGRTRLATIFLHVSLSALRRGKLEDGEICEIPGVGPVPLAVAEHLMGDSITKLVIADGVDVNSVCHLGRTVPTHIETALEARDRTCVVPGCDAHLSLEIDHWKIPFARGGPTELWNLARLCRFHHQLKTYGGFELSGGPGAWEWAGPTGGSP